MNRQQQQRIDSIREGLLKMAEASGRIWGKLNERSARFDRHDKNVGLSPCQEATLLAQAAASILADAELVLAAAQSVRDDASLYSQAATQIMHEICSV